MKLYRIQHSNSGNGMWNTFSESGEALVTYLSNEKMAELPMPYSDVYGACGRRWYSSADSLELLHEWFSPDDIFELVTLGFEVFEIDTEQYHFLENEVIFTKESVTSWVNITYRYFPDLKSTCANAYEIFKVTE